MELQLESTNHIVRVEGLAMRVWEGRTADAVPCYALIAFVAVELSHDTAAFDHDLIDRRSRPEIDSVLDAMSAIDKATEEKRE